MPPCVDLISARCSYLVICFVILDAGLQSKTIREDYPERPAYFSASRVPDPQLLAVPVVPRYPIPSRLVF